jgi:hypothetical protein
MMREAFKVKMATWSPSAGARAPYKEATAEWSRCRLAREPFRVTMEG